MGVAKFAVKVEFLAKLMELPSGSEITGCRFVSSPGVAIDPGGIIEIEVEHKDLPPCRYRGTSHKPHIALVCPIFETNPITVRQTRFKEWGEPKWS